MDFQQILKELKFSSSRSSGPGGQHVNKTSSKITLRFVLAESQALSHDQKELLQNRLKNRLNQKGELIMSCGETRSQHRNKALLIDRFIELLIQNLKRTRQRKKTKPGRAAIEKRLKDKKRQALKKSHRRRPPTE